MTDVAIWGSYHYGNFGDDLMAEVFASAARQFGARPSVISRNAHIVQSPEVQVAPTLDALTAEPDLIIIGGGAMLSSDRMIDFLARPASRAVDREFGELLRYCRTHSSRVVPLSIGGDGDGKSTGIWGNRRRFFDGPWARYGSVRLSTDAPLVERLFHKQYAYHPDVLFAAPRYVSNSQGDRSPNSGGARLGVNLHRKRAAPFVGALEKAFGAEVEIVPLVTHSHVFGDPYEWTNDNDTVRYSTVTQFVEALTELDGIVSDKLHVGLVSATLGVPFVSYQPKPKTRGLHRELGLSSAVADTPDEATSLVQSAILDQSSPTLRERISSEGLGERAVAHIDLLRHALIHSGS